MELEQEIIKKYPEYKELKEKMTDEEILEIQEHFKKSKDEYLRASNILNLQFKSKAGIDYSTDYQKALDKSELEDRKVKEIIESKTINLNVNSQDDYIENIQKEINKNEQEDIDRFKYDYITEAIDATISKYNYKSNLVGDLITNLLNGHYEFITRDNNYRKYISDNLSPQEIARIIAKYNKTELNDEMEAINIYINKVKESIDKEAENSKQY